MLDILSINLMQMLLTQMLKHWATPFIKIRTGSCMGIATFIQTLATVCTATIQISCIHICSSILMDPLVKLIFSYVLFMDCWRALQPPCGDTPCYILHSKSLASHVPKPTPFTFGYIIVTICAISVTSNSENCIDIHVIDEPL